MAVGAVAFIDERALKVHCLVFPADPVNFGRTRGESEVADVFYSTAVARAGVGLTC